MWGWWPQKPYMENNLFTKISIDDRRHSHLFGRAINSQKYLIYISGIFKNPISFLNSHTELCNDYFKAFLSTSVKYEVIVLNTPFEFSENWGLVDRITVFTARSSKWPLYSDGSIRNALEFSFSFLNVFTADSYSF